MAKGEADLLLIGGALAIAYFGIIKPITNKLGLTQSAKDTAEANAAVLATGNSAWNANFYHQYTASHSLWTLFTKATAVDIATRIYNSWGILHDDDSTIVAEIKRCKSQIMLSQVVEQYRQLFSRDLIYDIRAPWYYLHDGLSDSQFAAVADYVNKLPVNI